MNIEFYEKEKNNVMQFRQLKDGDFFLTAFDRDSKDMRSTDAHREIFKRVEGMQSFFNCIRLEEESFVSTILEHFDSDILVYRVEIKKIVIDVDW